MYEPEYFEKLAEIYSRVGKSAKQQYVLHGDRLKCGKGCSACCVNGIEVVGIEAENIRKHHSALLKNEKPNTAGGCAFLNETGACRIYENRPLICRLYGPPLSRIVIYQNKKTEVRDICPLNTEGIPIDDLPNTHVLDAETPEDQLVRLQLRADGGAKHRMMLRDLFV